MKKTKLNFDEIKKTAQKLDANAQKQVKGGTTDVIGIDDLIIS